MADKVKINSYKIGEDTYTKLINSIAILPDIKVNQESIINILNPKEDISTNVTKEEISDEKVTEILTENTLDIPEVNDLEKAPAAPVVHAPVVHAPVVHEPVVPAPVVNAPVVHAPVVSASVPIVHAPVVPETKLNVEVKIKIKEETKSNVKVKEEPKPKLVRHMGNINNYTIIEVPKLFTGKLNVPIFHNVRLGMKGGGEVKSRKYEIMKLLLNSTDNILADIAIYYFYNLKENGNPKILNGNDIINIMVSFIYNEFIESELETCEIINPEYIKNIPDMYKFNFTDKVRGDIEKVVPNYETKINILNENVMLLKKIVYNSMDNKPKQSGGKSQDKTIEEKINKNIENISTFLKSKSIKTSQKGGAISPAQMFANIQAYQLIPNPTKDQTRAIKDNCNIWVVELLEQKLATKEIRDNQYNIARFYLTTPVPGPNITHVIDFINLNASMLTLEDSDRIKHNMPNEMKVEKLGNATRGTHTDKLKEYFNKKYQNLLELQNTNHTNEVKPKEPTTEIGKIKLILSQSGGSKLKMWEKCVLNYNINKEKGINTTYNCGPKPKDNEDLEAEDLEETCFTSKQYTIFLRKMVGYFKSINKNMNQADLDLIEGEIETLKRIEKNLLKNNTLFNNYRKIQEVYPDKLYSNITMQHLQNIEDTNSQIIDQYGKVNTKIIDTIKAVEKYSEMKQIEADAKKYPNLENELNRLTQAGGGSNKPYLKFNNFHDVEYFVSRGFEKFTKDNKGQIEEDN